MLLEGVTIARKQENNVNDWNGESSIFFVYILDQFTVEGIHLQEHIIKVSRPRLG